MLKQARGWFLADYSTEMLLELGLPEDHNNRRSQQDLSGYNLERANFIGCDLTDFMFNNAQLQGAIFFRANLTKADLENAHLEGADFRGAKGYKPGINSIEPSWTIPPDSMKNLKT